MVYTTAPKSSMTMKARSMFLINRVEVLIAKAQQLVTYLSTGWNSSLDLAKPIMLIIEIHNESVRIGCHMTQKNQLIANMLRECNALIYHFDIDIVPPRTSYVHWTGSMHAPIHDNINTIMRKLSYDPSLWQSAVPHAMVIHKSATNFRTQLIQGTVVLDR